MGACALVREEAEHEILEEAGWVGCDGDVDAAGGVGGLLEECGVAGELYDVDGDVEALAGEDAVHYGDVVVGGVGGAA